jgi:gluconolactonase
MAQAPGDGTPFVAHRDKFHKILGPDFQRPVLIETNAHEGPVYVAREHALYFTTVPEPGPSNIAIMRLQLGGERFPFTPLSLETVRQPSNMANGMTLDRKGRLVICEQGTRTEPARISRMDLKTRALETVVDQWRGLHFNSPNDVVVKSDKTVWFTDPNYGEIQGFKPPPEIGAFVYRHDPTTGETAVVADSFNKPNGLAFSPDESVLYITDTGANQAPGTYRSAICRGEPRLSGRHQAGHEGPRLYLVRVRRAGVHAPRRSPRRDHGAGRRQLYLRRAEERRAVYPRRHKDLAG